MRSRCDDTYLDLRCVLEGGHEESHCVQGHDNRLWRWTEEELRVIETEKQRERAHRRARRVLVR